MNMLNGSQGPGYGSGMSLGNGMSSSNGLLGMGFNNNSNSSMNSMGNNKSGLDLPNITGYGPSTGNNKLGDQYHPYNSVAKEFGGEDNGTSNLLKGTSFVF